MTGRLNSRIEKLEAARREKLATIPKSREEQVRELKFFVQRVLHGIIPAKKVLPMFENSNHEEGSFWADFQTKVIELAEEQERKAEELKRLRELPPVKIDNAHIIGNTWRPPDS